MQIFNLHCNFLSTHGLYIRYRQSGNKSDWTSSYVRMQKLDLYHGQPSGIFGCDEHLAGTMPSRGTELCTVVEAMFSYETLFEIQGDPIFGICFQTPSKLTFPTSPLFDS